MTAVKAYYDGTTFVPVQNYTFKPRQQAVIVVDEEIEESKVPYSESLAAFRARHSDFLSDAAEMDGLDSVFDDVRDKGERLRGSESGEW